jgi:parallel beta-helix repeat protein
LSKQGYLRLRPSRFATAGVFACAVVGMTASLAVAAGPKTFYVSAKHGNNANPCTKSAPCKTIEHALARTHAGDTVVVESGVYSQFVSIKKRVRMIGQGQPIDNLTGKDNGFNIDGPGAAGTVISGFTIEHATFEGILARRTSHLTITNNVVRDNDLGIKAKNPTGECAPFGGGPGDCGEGIHFNGVTGSTIAGNVVKGNTGGVLFTDEAGPTAHNLVAHNTIQGNVLDCGITLAGHSPKATLKGAPQPKLGGVYKNRIFGNLVTGNGTKGEGAGILLAVGAPGGAVYNNLIQGNTANGNGLAGITIHSHAFPPLPNGQQLPSGDLNGNSILNNSLKHDGIADKSEQEFGPKNFPNTVGILVGSGVVKLKGITIAGNTITNTHFGIYTMNVPNKISATKNSFHNVKVKVKQV